MSQANSLIACDPQSNATVSASAGSGKTWLLITRIVRLLISGAEPGNIIALTFTRKAAAEMQIRLSQRLFEMATADEQALETQLELIGCDTRDNTKHIAAGLYEKLIHSLYPIRIQTFHSFCQDILSRFPLEADIPPGFELLEDSSLLERQAWHMLFDEAGLQERTNRSKKDSHHLAGELDTIMQLCNGPDNTRTALDSFLSHRSDWWAYTSRSKRPVEYACKQLARSLQLEPESIDTDIEQEKRSLIESFFEKHNIEKLQRFASFLLEIQNKTSEKHAASIDSALRPAIDTGTAFLLVTSAFIKKDGDKMVQGRQLNTALEKKLGGDGAERFIELHHDIADQIISVNEQIKRRLTLRMNRAWYITGHHYVEIFQLLKREMRLLDFTDLEWKCYQLLQHADNAHWVQYKIDQRIDHLLIDEFQDTNPTQWHLLSPILEEIAANPEQRPRSVFLVGDEKQSIYSFRRANPALQAQASEWLAQHLYATAAPLDFSRRSSSAIIQCVNAIFEQDEVKRIMTGFTTHGTHLDTLPGKVLLTDLFEVEEETEDTAEAVYFRDPLKQPRMVSLKTLRHREADYIARQILEITSGSEIVTIDGTPRRAEFGDIMILMRNRTHIAIYEEALKKHGIAFIGSKKGGLLDNLEIQDLSCLLETLITPFDNLALAQVLRSPIFSATDDDLMLLASYRHTVKQASKHWYENLLQLAEQHTAEEQLSGNAQTLSRPLRRAASLLPHWQSLAQKLPVHDCLDRIFSEGNIINRYTAANKQDNKQKVAVNCQRFLELSLEVDSGRYPSITRFLQRLHHLENYSDSPPEEPLSQSDESRVRLMTIHASKGLEAPVVFLADCNSTARNNNAYSSLVQWPADKSQPVNFQLQLSKENTDQVTSARQQKKLDDQAREELNLLYVALTRAREQLYISGVASRSRQSNSWYQVIASGLESITTQETTVYGINCRVFRHLHYEDISAPIRSSVNTLDELEPSAFDERLLSPFDKAVTGRYAEMSYMISPSLFGDEAVNIGTALDHDTVKTAHSITTSDEATDSETAESESIAAWRGTLIHRALELFCRNGEYPPGDQLIDDVHDQIRTELIIRKPALLDKLQDYLQEAATCYSHQQLTSVFAPAADAQTYDEMPLMYKISSRPVYGIVDRVIKQENSVIIIDYKSHRLHGSLSLDDIAMQFKTQLDYYRDGARLLWPDCEIKSGILFTHYQEMIWL